MFFSGQKHSFTFDRVFMPDAPQEDVFVEISQLVQSALDGYKVIYIYLQDLLLPFSQFINIFVQSNFFISTSLLHWMLSFLSKSFVAIFIGNLLSYSPIFSRGLMHSLCSVYMLHHCLKSVLSVKLDSIFSSL